MKKQFVIFENGWKARVKLQNRMYKTQKKAVVNVVQRRPLNRVKG